MLLEPIRRAGGSVVAVLAMVNKASEAGFEHRDHILLVTCAHKVTELLFGRYQSLLKVGDKFYESSAPVAVAAEGVKSRLHSATASSQNGRSHSMNAPTSMPGARDQTVITRTLAPSTASREPTREEKLKLNRRLSYGKTTAEAAGEKEEDAPTDAAAQRPRSNYSTTSVVYIYIYAFLCII